MVGICLGMFIGDCGCCEMAPWTRHVAEAGFDEQQLEQVTEMLSVALLSTSIG